MEAPGAARSAQGQRSWWARISPTMIAGRDNQQVTTGRPGRRRVPAGILTGLAVAAAVYGPSTVAWLTLTSDEPWSWSRALSHSLIFGVGWGVVFTIIMGVVDRRTGRQAARHELQRRVAEGALPAGATYNDWEPRLREEVTRLRLVRWLLPSCFAMEAFLLAAVALTTDGSTWGLWFAAGAATAAATAWLTWATRRRQVTKRLLAELPQP